MAYDEALAERVLDLLVDQQALTERRMFGGVAFMLRGNMGVGVTGDDLMVRVGPDAYEQTLAHPDAREMDFTGRPMRGFVFVQSEGLAKDDELEAWVRRGVDFALSLPPK